MEGYDGVFPVAAFEARDDAEAFCYGHNPPQGIYRLVLLSVPHVVKGMQPPCIDACIKDW